MLQVHHSNDIDRLADALADALRAQPSAPLEPELVIVSSSALGRWLGFALADRLEIFANVRTALPATYVWALIRQVLEDVPERSPLAAEALAWRIARLLRRLPDGTSFAPVRRYLREGSVDRRIELGRELAIVFERYAVDRPQWIEAWLNGLDPSPRARSLGPDEAWQRWLMQAIAADAPQLPHAHPMGRFFQALEEGEAGRPVPRRLSVFGVTHLPRLYLDFFVRLGEHADVTLYVRNPCRQYWGDIVRARRAARAAVHAPAVADALDTGNRLFASLAQHGRAFFDRLVERDAPGDALYREPEGGTLLATLQRHILDLQSPEATIEVDPNDSSIALHVCHSPMREVEVLHDQLLAHFAADPTLAPEQVLVLVPDLPGYAPIIDAVFAAVPAPRRIPFALGDRGSVIDSPLVASVLALMALPRGRLAAEEVLGLLETPALGRRFGIGPEDLGQVRDWVLGAGIRWGQDEHMRARAGLPATRETTWEAGLDALVLGAAMGCDTPWRGVAPFPDLEGTQTDLLGRFVAFVQAVFRVLEAAHTDCPIGEWRTHVDRLLDACYAPEPVEEAELQRLRSVLEALDADVREAGFDEAIPYEVFRRTLLRRLAGQPLSSRLRAGGVNVAEFAIGNIVPARLVYLVGMNEGEFPHADVRRGFDLVERAPDAQDRRRRDEDRYAFLLAFMAARDQLRVSYCGRDSREDSERAPSIVVDELLDAIRRTAHAAGGGDPVDALTTVHPLQPFSERYGGADGIFTYASEWFAGADRPVRAFDGGGLGVPGPESRDLTIEELLRFFARPTQSILRRRLGLALVRSSDVLSDTEPFALDPLAAYQLSRELVAARFGDAAEVEHVRARAMGRGLLPAGPVGEAIFEDHAGRLDQLIEALGTAVESARPQSVDLAIGPFRVAGAIDPAVNGLRTEWNPGVLHARFRLRAWIRHLVSCAAFAASTPTRLLGVPRKGKAGRLDEVRFRALERDVATGHLEHLLEIYWEGMQALIPLYPDSACAFVEAEREGKDPFAAAREVWIGSGNGRRRGESEDAHVALAVRGREDPLDERFASYARRVYAPLIEASEVA